MISKLWFVAFITLASLASAHETEFLLTIFRHGARREARGLQLFDSYPDEFTGVGDLTPVGARQMYLLGKAIRAKYEKLFSKIVFPSQISMPSSCYNRTVTSGASELFGLFDLGSGGSVESEDKSLLLPPIKGFDFEFPDGNAALPGRANLFPMEVFSNFESYVFLPDNEVVCKGMREARKLKFKEMISKDSRYFEPLWKALTKAGFKPEDHSKEKKKEWDLVIGFELCDLIISRAWNDPSYEVDESLRTQCLYLHTYFNFRLLSDAYQPLVAQKINESVIAALKDFRDDRSGPLKALFFSGHDTNFSMFLLNFYPKNHECVRERYLKRFGPDVISGTQETVDDQPCIEIASYSANVILDVYRENDKLWVELLVNNERLPVDSTGKNLSLDAFIRSLEARTTSQWEDFCYVDRGGVRFNRWLLLLTFISFVGLAFLGALYFKEVKRREDLIQPTDEFREKLVL